MIDDQVAGNLIKPTLRSLPFRFAAKGAMNADESLLEDIFGLGIIPHPAADESQKPPVISVP
jgi:hypothetical protein